MEVALKRELQRVSEHVQRPCGWRKPTHPRSRVGASRAGTTVGPREIFQWQAEVVKGHPRRALKIRVKNLACF